MGPTSGPRSSTRLSFEQWLAAEVDDTLARDLLRAFMAGGYMTKPADTFSVLSALATVAGAGSVANLFEPDLCLHSRVVGGSQLIPLRLAERLGDRVVLDAPVRTLRWTDDTVIAEAGNLSVSADAAVVAVPPNVAGLIRFEPPLPAWRMRLHQAMTQGDVIKVLAVYDEPFWRTDGLAGEGFAPYELVREVYDNTPPAGRPGVLCTFLAGEKAHAAEQLDATERRRARARRAGTVLRPAGPRCHRSGRAELVGGGVDARGVCSDLRHRRALAPRSRPHPTRRFRALGLHRPRRRRAHAHGRRNPLGTGSSARNPGATLTGATVAGVVAAENLWRAWSFQPLVIGGGLLAIAFFLSGWLRLNRRRRGLVPWTRIPLFVAGVVVTVLAIVSPIDAIGERYLQSVHMLQHVLIADLGVMLTVVAVRGPMTVFFLPRDLLVPLARIGPLRGLLRFLLRPGVSYGLWLLVLVSWHVPPFYEAALNSRVWHDLMHLSFIVGGLLVWTQIVDPSRHRRLSVPERLGYTALVFWTGQILAYVILFDSSPLFSPYVDQPVRLLGLSPLTDQKLAGVVMMVEQFATVGVAFVVLLLAARRRAQPSTPAVQSAA